MNAIAATSHKILAYGSLYSSYSVAVLYAAWTLVITGFQLGIIADFQTPQRAAFLAVVTYWTTITVFGGSTLVLLVARWFHWRYVAATVASFPPLYELTIYVVYPLAKGTTPINYLGLVLWAWMLPMVVALVHWEHERLEWIEAGAGDPVLAVVPADIPHGRRIWFGARRRPS